MGADHDAAYRLGPEALRDLLAYICGEAAQQFRIIDLSEAYTADSRTGLFANNTPGGGMLQLPKTGNLTIDGGTSFSKLATGTDDNLRDVSFVDESRGWAVGPKASMLKFKRSF